MKLNLTHHIGLATAKKAALLAWAYHAQRWAKYQPQMVWDDDRRARVIFSVQGVTITVFLNVNPHNIELSAAVPFVFKLFTKQAIAVVKREFQHWVGAAQSALKKQQGEDADSADIG
ncbi:MAG: hypothetical protein QNJ97_15260 [Myxococcota bacterium]|nr:hypothetical protein [Myxococcota bacterium]